MKTNHSNEEEEEDKREEEEEEVKMKTTDYYCYRLIICLLIPVLNHVNRQYVVHNYVI